MRQRHRDEQKKEEEEKEEPQPTIFGKPVPPDQVHSAAPSPDEVLDLVLMEYDALVLPVIEPTAPADVPMQVMLKKLALQFNALVYPAPADETVSTAGGTVYNHAALIYPIDPDALQ